MRRAIVGFAIFAAGLAGCWHTPMPWSPDGTWIAYTVEVRPTDQLLAPGWLFEVGRPTPRPSSSPVVGYRLWATRAATNTSVLLEDSPGPLTAPGWSPDGHALAFGRVVTDADRSSRFEVVVIEGLAKRRVLSSRPLTALDGEVSRLAGQAIAWSPDGRYLAVPQLDPLGLVILRADNGRTVNVIPDAFLPSWSPTGGRLAFYVRSHGQTLQYIDNAIGQPRPLVEVGQATQAPGWTHDGTTLLVVAQRDGPRPGKMNDVRERPMDAGEPRELLRIQLRGDNFTVEPLRVLGGELGANRDRVVEGVSISFDRDAENVFCSTLVEGQPHQVTWYHSRGNAIFKKFPMIDPAIPVGSLSCSPDGRTLAARSGSTSSLGYPVFCDTESPDLRSRLVAPDDSARLEWIATLTRAARLIIAGLPSTSIRPDAHRPRSVERPTLLPVQSEFAANAEASHRLRRIGRMGRPLCDRAPESGNLDPATRRIFDEARLFFDYLREDYGSALITLADLEGTAETPDHRVALLTIRAQILVNQGQTAAAKRVIAFLERIEGPPTRRVEWTGLAYKLTEIPEAGRGWPRFLAEAVVILGAEASDPQRTDDNLEPNLDRNLPLFRPPLPFGPGLILPPGDLEPPAFQQPIRRRPRPRPGAMPNR